jgi:peptidoglycan-associated lipoprotein
MPTALRPLVLLSATALCIAGAQAQSKATATRPVGRISLAFTYDAQGSNLTTSSRFWLQGGAAELNMRLYRGLGATVSVLGLHAGNTIGGAPVNLVTEAFGPSYTFTRPLRSHTVSLFARGLAGEANGFNGVYPSAGGPITSSNSFAMLAGGGVDIGLSRHIALRLVQADYVRIQLPNSITNVQNNFRLGAGIILH